MAKRNKGAGFLDANLELLGFGNEKDALIQAVKELFENGTSVSYNSIMYH
jgi:DNA topoisomerase VI subunit B